jgi:epoxyqueuosine reductase
MTTSTSEPPPPPERARDLIRAEAHRLGFDLCRFTDLDDAWPAAARLGAFLEAGRHGEMSWMAETAERRAHPRAMWAGARSAIVLGMNYGPDTDPLASLADPGRATLSVYARGDDYHELIKGRLKQLAGWLQARFGGQLKVFVDTAPLMEKPLAERAGLGWQGRHTNLVSREFGSWLFLGSILTSLELPPDPPGADHCGRCTACLDICPTNAFPASHQLDARRCISYLTIELKGPIPAEFRGPLGNRIYGCDDCLAVCPWNKFAQTAREQRLAARQALRSPTLAELSRLDDAAFRALFAKSPVKRIGRDRFLRNVLYAIGNSGQPELAADAVRLAADPSALVRGAAVWALSRLLDPAAFETLSGENVPNEGDPQVLEEWAAGSAPAASAGAGNLGLLAGGPVLAVMPLGEHLLRQPVEAAVEVLALVHGQPAAGAAILPLEALDLAELHAQTPGFRTRQVAPADAGVDPLFEVGLTLVDRLPGRGLGRERRGGQQGRRGGQRNDQGLLHGACFLVGGPPASAARRHLCAPLAERPRSASVGCGSSTAARPP